ncbi:MAG: complex I NDUFA9 subunit family protein [Anaerolineales bacterium]
MILVTGGSGYLGSHIVRRLLESGKPVRVLVHNLERAQREGRLKDLSVELITGDVTRPETLGPAMQGVTAVIHTVAIAIERGGSTYELVNTQGTVNVVDAAREAGIRRFVNICQLGASAELPYRFLASKGKAQEYVAASGLDWTAFRPSVIWGPEDEFANTFARLAPITPIIFPIVGGPEARFQPVWVEDVATAVVKSLDDPTTFRKEFELGGPEVLTLEQIERRTLEAVGARRIMIRFPMALLRLVVRLMEATLRNPPVTRSLLELLAVSNVTSDNALTRFVEAPRAFTAEAASEYMSEFRVSETLRQYFRR